MKWPLWAEISFREMLHGVREVPGLGNNARILTYHQSTNLKASEDSVPWCAAFVGWALHEARVFGSQKPNARSYLEWGERCYGRLGGIVVLWRGQRDGWKGHVGFLVGEENGSIYVLGGNQRDAVSIQAYSADRLLGYRWPRNEDYMGGEQ